MRYRVVFLTGFAAGYVLGARAGRHRYEQIVSGVRSILGRPEVERLAGEDAPEPLRVGAP